MYNQKELGVLLLLNNEMCTARLRFPSWFDAMEGGGLAPELKVYAKITFSDGSCYEHPLTTEEEKREFTSSNEIRIPMLNEQNQSKEIVGMEFKFENISHRNR